jgi:hypothetical protein
MTSTPDARRAKLAEQQLEIRRLALEDPSLRVALAEPMPDDE